MSQVPGITAKHAIITPECRAGRTDLGAFDEALDRLRTEYLKVLDLRGEEGPANYHLVLSVEGLEPAKPSSRLTADPEDPRRWPDDLKVDVRALTKENAR